MQHYNTGKHHNVHICQNDRTQIIFKYSKLTRRRNYHRFEGPGKGKQSALVYRLRHNKRVRFCPNHESEIHFTFSVRSHNEAG